jgi:hypothetical protein
MVDWVNNIFLSLHFVTCFYALNFLNSLLPKSKSNPTLITEMFNSKSNSNLFLRTRARCRNDSSRQIRTVGRPKFLSPNSTFTSAPPFSRTSTFRTSWGDTRTRTTTRRTTIMKTVSFVRMLGEHLFEYYKNFCSNVKRTFVRMLGEHLFEC